MQKKYHSVEPHAEIKRGIRESPAGGKVRRSRTDLQHTQMTDTSTRRNEGMEAAVSDVRADPIVQTVKLSLGTESAAEIDAAVLEFKIKQQLERDTTCDNLPKLLAQVIYGPYLITIHGE
jgi:hypothetical protein